MMRRIWAVSLNTFRETVRDRLLQASAVLIAALIFFSLFLGSISLEQDKKIIQDMGLAAIFLFQVFITIFIGASLMYKEIERRTFMMILSKPVTAAEIILGKGIGLGLTNLLMTFLTTLVFSAILFSKFHTLGGMLGLWLAILLGFAETILLIFLSLFFSSFTSAILAAIYTAAVFLIGHSSNLILALVQKGGENPFLKYILYGFYYVFPHLERFNIRNEVVYGFLPGPPYFILVLAYGLFYGIFLFLAASFIFERKEY